MSEELTIGTTTWHTTITSPTTGDAVAQAAWKDGNQDLADNVGYVKAAALDAGGSGIVAIRTAASVAALKALTGMSVGDVATIAGSGRLYQFRATSVSTWGGEDGYEYEADDTSGYWYCGQPMGLETVAIDHVGYGTIDTSVGVWQAITGDTNWHDISDGGGNDLKVTISEDLLEGDEILIHGHLQCGHTNAATCCFRVDVYFDSADHEVDGSGVYIDSTTDTQAAEFACVYTVPIGGASGAIVKIQGKISDAGETLNIADTGLSLVTEVKRLTPW